VCEVGAERRSLVENKVRAVAQGGDESERVCRVDHVDGRVALVVAGEAVPLGDRQTLALATTGEVDVLVVALLERRMSDGERDAAPLTHPVEPVGRGDAVAGDHDVGVVVAVGRGVVLTGRDGTRLGAPQ